MIKKIDELTIDDHYHLDRNDHCWYFGEYTSNTSYNHSPTNQLIANFKKSLEVKGTAQWQYKQKAIREVAELFTKELRFTGNPNTICLVPIPPSKIKTNPLYDDRMKQVLEIYVENTQMEYKELIKINKDMAAFHISTATRNPNTLIGNLEIDISLSENLRQTVVLVDDVITTGCHFKACKKLIQNTFPNTNVIGIFIARRNFPV